MSMTQICQAKSKQSGQQCRNFATKGKNVCRFHGGRSTGPKTPEGLARCKQANTIHGRRSKEAIQEAREVRELISETKIFIANL